MQSRRRPMNPGSILRFGKRGRMRFAAVGVGIAVVVAGGAVACGGGSKKAQTPPAAPATAAPTKASPDIQALHQAFVNAIEKWNAKDLDGFIALFTGKGFVSSFGQDGQSVAETRAG